MRHTLLTIPNTVSVSKCPMNEKQRLDMNLRVSEIASDVL